MEDRAYYLEAVRGEADEARGEAWEALEKLKERYDKAFSKLEDRIKARFRA